MQLIKHQKKKNIIAIGDFNVDAKRMKDKTYRHKGICGAITEMNDTSDLKMAELPETYFSRKHNYKSSLDHIYYSSTLENEISYKATDHAASDHIPIMFELKGKTREAK